MDVVSTFNFEVLCVNDGSKDSTFACLCEIADRDHRFCVVDSARNFGKEAALTAGIDYATGHAVIPIDADLQDPPELIPKLLAEWENGIEIVLANRMNRPRWRPVISLGGDEQTSPTGTLELPSGVER